MSSVVHYLLLYLLNPFLRLLMNLDELVINKGGIDYIKPAEVNDIELDIKFWVLASNIILRPVLENNDTNITACCFSAVVKNDKVTVTIHDLRRSAFWTSSLRKIKTGKLVSWRLYLVKMQPTPAQELPAKQRGWSRSYRLHPGYHFTSQRESIS